MKWLRRATRAVSPGSRTLAEEQIAVARLTARADMILDDLDVVVKQMGSMLREKVDDEG